MREAERDAEIRRDLRTVVRAAEHPDLWDRRSTGLCEDVAKRMTLHQFLSGEPGQQVAHLRRKVVGSGFRQRIEREGGASVGAGCATKTEIDTTRRDRLQDAELLGYLQARVMRQHHACRADADARRGGGDGADQDLRRGAGLARRVVVFGAPVASIAQDSQCCASARLSRIEVSGERPVTTVDWSRTESRSISDAPRAVRSIPTRHGRSSTSCRSQQGKTWMPTCVGMTG